MLCPLDSSSGNDDVRTLALAVLARTDAKPQVPFRALADEWLKAIEPRRVEPENERRYVRHLRPLWELTQSRLTPLVVQAALDSLLLAPQTRNKVRGAGLRIIRHAQRSGVWTAPNPFELTDRARERQSTFALLTMEEATALASHLAPPLRRMFWVALFLGLRPGELVALRREDVDLERGSILIRRSKERDETKTGRQRLIPILKGCAAELKEALLVAPGALVFPREGSDTLRDTHELSKRLRAAMVRAGICERWTLHCQRGGRYGGCGWHGESPERPDSPRCPQCGWSVVVVGRARRVRWYDLRHTSATLHREAGDDALAIRLLLGHSGRDTTERRYLHPSLDWLARSLSKLKRMRRQR